MAVDILQFLNEAGTTTAAPPRLVSWIPPSEGVALNSDGNSFGNPGNAGFGGLLRDADGAWLFGFYGTIGLADSLLAELLDLLMGLSVGWNKGFRRVDCFCDSNNDIHLIMVDDIQYH
ncbi:Ribonuclease H-like superfamily [Sesbania bispinosa]|nr:Ribonuclease H-like superfamily [Sesbania bispinosa]